MFSLMDVFGIKCGKCGLTGVTVEELLPGVLAPHVLGQLLLVSTVEEAHVEGTIHDEHTTIVIHEVGR